MSSFNDKCNSITILIPPFDEDGFKIVKSKTKNKNNQRGKLQFNKTISCDVNLNRSSLQEFKIHQKVQNFDGVRSLNEKDIRPFWNNSSSELSKNFWLPLETESLDYPKGFSGLFDIGFMSGILSSDMIIDKSSTEKMLKNKSKQHGNVEKKNISSKKRNKKPIKNAKKKTTKKCKVNDEDIDKIIEDLDKEEEKAQKKKKKKFVTRRIRIYPSKTQKSFFGKCFGTSRYFYNKAVEYTNNEIKINSEVYKRNVRNGCIFMEDDEQCCDDVDREEKYFCEEHKNDKKRWAPYQTNLILGKLREKVMVSDKNMKPNELWQKEIPFDTRQLILKDFIEAYNASKTNKIRGHIKDFKMGFKSRKNTTQIFHINKKAIDKNLDIFKRRKLGKLRRRDKMNNWIKNNIDNIDANCKIICYGRQQYYVLLSIPAKENNTKEKPFDIAVLDPGVKTFQTLYSPNGIIGKFGDNFCEDNLQSIAERIDELDSIASKSNCCKTKLHIRRRQSLLRTKIKNIVNNLHWEVINFLCTNFKIIITTYFEVKDMVNKTTRNIRNKSVRKMLTLSHYAFKRKLESRCKINGNILIIANEAYTSKTCGCCGHFNDELKGKRVFECGFCGLIIDRDINGARNILIRLLSKLLSKTK